MALIEIPNVYNSDMTARASGRGRLAIVGEPIVAVDLINTGAAPGSAVTNDPPVGGARRGGLVAD
jgi:hypothetical protein